MLRLCTTHTESQHSATDEWCRAKRTGQACTQCTSASLRSPLTDLCGLVVNLRGDLCSLSARVSRLVKMGVDRRGSLVETAAHSEAATQGASHKPPAAAPSRLAAPPSAAAAPSLSASASLSSSSPRVAFSPPRVRTSRVGVAVATPSPRLSRSRQRQEEMAADRARREHQMQIQQLSPHAATFVKKLFAD